MEADAYSRTMEAAAVEAVKALSSAGIGSLVLHGPAVARWLYRDPEAERRYGDVDLLLPPGSLEEAGRVLRPLGFVLPRETGTRLSGDEAEALQLHRDTDATVLELHARVAGAEAPPQRVWEILGSRAEPLALADGTVTGLDAAGRAVLVVLHAAEKGRHEEKAVDDLRRALAHVPTGEWADAAALADDLGAQEALSAGLRLTADGRALAERLSLPLPGARAVLTATAAPELREAALALERVTAGVGWHARARLVLREVVPPPGVMRSWSPLARRGPVGLVAAYLSRVAVLVRRSVPAIRALLEARRAGR